MAGLECDGPGEATSQAAAEELQFGRWPKGQGIPFDEFAAMIAKRRAAKPGLVIPRNAGNRRTESKKALLRAIEEAGGKW